MLFNNIGIAPRYYSLLFGYGDKCFENKQQSGCMPEGKVLNSKFDLYSRRGQQLQCIYCSTDLIYTGDQIVRNGSCKHMRGEKKELRAETTVVQTNRLMAASVTHTCAGAG